METTKQNNKVSSFKEFTHSVSRLGNEYILNNHIGYFEKRVIEEQEICKYPEDFSSCPNFTAWLRLYTDFITNLIFWQYFIVTGKNWEEVSKIKYQEIVKILRNKLREIISDNKELEDIIHNLKLIIELRHCFVHGGMPNPMREIGRKEGFKDIKEEEIIFLSTPKNFEKTKEIFKKTYNTIKNLKGES